MVKVAAVKIREKVYRGPASGSLNASHRTSVAAALASQMFLRSPSKYKRSPVAPFCQVHDSEVPLPMMVLRVNASTDNFWDMAQTDGQPFGHRDAALSRTQSLPALCQYHPFVGVKVYT